MASNISSMLQFWKSFNLLQLQRNLDVTATELANRQDESDASKRRLVEQSKEFKKSTPEDMRKVVAPLLRSFQTEVDALSKRSKACEADFLNLYKKIIELPDPVVALEQAEVFQRKSQRLNDIETENQKLRETLNEYIKEFAEVKNQEVTIKNLREKVRDFEKDAENRAKQLVLEKNEELEKKFDQKEKQLQETQLLIATKLGEAEQMASTFKAALDSSQGELFDLKSKYDEETAAKQAELDLVLADLDRSAQRAMYAEKEIESLREKLTEDNVSKHLQKRSSTMEEAIEALSRSSLEAELSAKEKEISQLVEDVQHLQASMGRLRESSASAIAKLEEELNERNELCQNLQMGIDNMSDYEEVKRELHIIKSTEFSSLEMSNSSDDKSPNENSSTSASARGKSLEMLLLEKNRAQQTENTSLRASNAQLSDTTADRHQYICTTPPASPVRNSEAVNNIFHHSPETELKNFPSSGTLSAYSQLSTLEHSLGTGDVSEYQFQKQQRINAIVNLKILANIKAAVAAKTMNSLPLSSNYLSPVRPSSSMFCGPPFKSGLGGANKIKPRYRPNTYASCVLARYLAHLQQVSQCSSSNALSSTTPEYHSRADLSDESGNESYSNHVFTSRKSRRKHFWDLNQNRVYPRPSEHSRSRIRNSIDSDHGGTSSIGQDRRSSNADSSAFEDVDTDELTFQVKEILQANNIGQRAFGQYVLGLSQGSVSEILSKPKPWSKLTFKGKEPFYKMMEFISTARNVEVLKALQRRDREDRVICSSKSYPLRHTESDSDRAIANILASAREEMRIEQEQFGNAQERYARQSSNENNHSNSRRELETSSDSHNTKKDTFNPEGQAPARDSRRAMALMTSGPCSHSYSRVMENETATISVSTNGAVASSQELPAMPSLIKRQHSTDITGSECSRALEKLKSKQESEEDSTDEQLPKLLQSVASASAQKSRNLHTSSSPVNEITVEKLSQSLERERNKNNIKGSLAQSKRRDRLCIIDTTFVKSEINENSEINYFTEVSKLKSANHPTPKGTCPTSEDLIASNHRLITSQENESLQRLFVTTTYNDPFIPPPLSPVAEENGNQDKGDYIAGGKSPGCNQEHNRYGSPFMDSESVSSQYMNDNAEESETICTSSDQRTASQNTICLNSQERKRISSLSPPSRHSGGLLSEPVLFKELSCPPSHVSVSDRESGACGEIIPTSVSNMLSSNQQMIMSSSSTSLYDSQASYTELNPVTTGSLFSSHHGVDFTNSTSNGYATIEGSQNGIASMLPPLEMKSSHGSTLLPTFSTLTNSLSSSKYADVNIKNLDSSSNEDDQSLEPSSLLQSSIPPETLHKLSMSYVDTVTLTKEVKDRLSNRGICQRIFGECILGLSQGTVSDILSHPKPWNKLTHKGREPFARMILWLADNTAGGLLPTLQGQPLNNNNHVNSPSSSEGGCDIQVIQSITNQEQASTGKSQSPLSIDNSESGSNYVSLSPATTAAPCSPHPMMCPISQDSSQHHMIGNNDSIVTLDSGSRYPGLERQHSTSSTPDHGGGGPPMTPLQQMLNIQELAASCPKLDTFALTRKVKDLLTEHNIGQRIFGQAVLGLTQGSVSDLLSRPKLWRSLSLKGREPFVRMQLWLSDPSNIEQLKSLKLERWMEKKWGGKRQRSVDNGMQHSLSPVKKQRIVLSTEEKEVLRRAYTIEPYPSQETVDMLANKLGRKSSTVVNWFHNYRSRVKRGFFPGDELIDANTAGKKGGSDKMTVKQLLDTITLTTHSDNQSIHQRESYNSSRSFASKNHTVDANNMRRHTLRLSDQQSPTWTMSRLPSPSSFDRYNSMDHMKTETVEQHFQNIERNHADELYANSVMHSIKQEPKLIPMHSNNDMVYTGSYSNSSALPCSGIVSEMTLNDAVAMATASSFVQPKSNQQFVGGSFYPPIIEHHDGYMPLTNENSYSKLNISPSSQADSTCNSMLPPVHTLTPKKSFGSPPSLSSSMLPSASSLLNPPPLNRLNLNKIPRLTSDIDLQTGVSHVDPYNNSRPIHDLLKLDCGNRTRYDMMVTNNNTNNNIIKNVTLPEGISLTITSSKRSESKNDSHNNPASIESQRKHEQEASREKSSSPQVNVSGAEKWSDAQKTVVASTTTSTAEEQSDDAYKRSEQLEKENIESLQKVEQQQQLIKELEHDLVVMQTSSPTAYRSAADGAPNPVTDMSSELVAGAVKQSTLNADPGTTSSSSSLLAIVTSQRERFRIRNQELEAENYMNQQNYNRLQNDLDSMRSDNIKLYEKIKFLQSYPATKVQVQDDVTAKRYSNQYEENLDPFTTFNKRERQRKYTNLSPHDKVTLNLGKFILSNKLARTVFFFYMLIVHCLLYLILYKYAYTEDCKHHIAELCYEKFGQQMVPNNMLAGAAGADVMKPK